MTKNVTLVTQDFYPLKGGISTYLMQIYRKYFTRENFQVIVPEHIGQAEDYQDLPFKVYRTVFNPFELDTPSRKQAGESITNILKQTNTDILLFGYLRSHPEIIRDYKKYKPSVKTGIIMHAKEAFIDVAIVDENHSLTGAHQGYTFAEAQFYKNVLQEVDCIFCISSFTKNLLFSQGIKNKFYLLPPAVKTPTLYNKGDCKSILGYSPDDFIILSVGRLIDRKGQHKIIESVSQLQKKIAALHYIIIGDGPNKKMIRDKITSYRLEEMVQLYDNIDDISLSKYYGAADIFVLLTNFRPPNDIEGFGIAFLEASMHQLPVIGGDAGGVNDAIANEINGYLINPHSTQELESRIINLYANPMLRANIGKQARARAIEKFNDTCSMDLITLFS